MCACGLFLTLMSCAADGGANMKITTHTVETPAGHIAYDVCGAGDPTVMFVHGAGCGRWQWYRQMADGLPGHRLVAIDLLGYGGSAKPEADYTMDMYVAGIVAVLDDIEVARAVLVGHSAGVAVVRHVVRCYPERVAAVGLIDGALRQPITAPVAAWMREAIERPDYESFMSTMAEHMPRGRLSDSDFEQVKKLSVDTPRHVRAGELAAMTDDAVWAMDPITVPVLAIKSTGPLAMPGPGDFETDLKTIAPHAEYHAWNDVGHFLMLEESERFNSTLEHFVVHMNEAQ